MSISFEFYSAYFKLQIVLPLPDSTTYDGILIDLVIVAVNVFQKQIKLSTLPVTKLFLNVESTQVTSLL